MNRQRLIRLLLIALLAIGITFAIDQREQFDADALEAWLQGFGVAAPLLFIVLYAIGTVLFFPGSILTLAGGALFGPLLGTLFNLIGATIGATIAFLIARYLTGDWVRERSGGRLKQLMDGVEGEGWRFVAFVRLVPLFPFNLLNYALGLTPIRLSHYVITSFIAMAPGAFAYTYLGFAGREAVAGSEGLIQKGLLALALLAVVAFLPRLIQKLRRGGRLTPGQLQALLDSDQPPLLLDVREEVAVDQAIDGAIALPCSEIMPRIHRLDGHRNGLIVLIGTVEETAAAKRVLGRIGFERLATYNDAPSGLEPGTPQSP